MPGRRPTGGRVSGSRVTFIGDVMAAVVHGVGKVRTLIGQPPVVVGGLAVMCRLSTPYRATTDLDVVDRLHGEVPQLQVLRAAQGAKTVEPAAVLLPTPYGEVKVDVNRRRQALRVIHDSGGADLTLDDVDLVAELLLAACQRS